ncbi:ABC transporter permease [Phytohabitans kaempferiae]|uniref:ABC transporter permease n=1 Tax=Phytohabitans kaempferiae TaxID=1620943 RepID=A0ABV6M6J3_9ACTN
MTARRHPVVRLVLMRVLASAVVLVGVTFVVFWGIDRAPGDPATAVLGPFATEQQRAAYIEANGLDDPMPVRFVRFIGDLSQGQLGRSATRPTDASALVAEAAPVTIQLTATALLLAAVLGVAVGIIAAARQGGGADRVIRLGTSVTLAAPDFWVGLVAIQVFAVVLGWLPSGGYRPWSAGPLDWLTHMAMPATVLALPLAAALANQVRSAMTQELDRDYVRSARGAGIAPARVFGSAFRNAATGPLTVLGLRASYLLSGAIVVEQIFNLPGLGTLLIQGVRQGDLAVTRAVALLGTIGILVVSLVLDLLYLALNPKART